MSDNNQAGTACDLRGIREAVCVHTDKISDSCLAKDCIEDLQVYLTVPSQQALDCAVSAKARYVELLHVGVHVETVPYSTGYYTVDLTFYYRVIADATLALDADAFDLPHQTPLVGGAASASLEPIADIINEPVASAPALREGKKSPAARAAALRNGKNPNEDDNPPEQRVAQPSTVREENGDRTNPDTGEIPVVQKDDGRISADPNDPEVAKAIRNEHIEQRKTKRTRTRRNRVIAIIVTIVVLLGLAGGAFATYRWSQTKYYIGDDNGEVAIFQGVPTSLFGFQLSHAVTDTHMKTSELPPSWQEQLAQGISFDTYGEAKTHTRLIKKQLKQQQDEAAQKEQDKANGESDNKSSGTTSDKSSGKSDKSDDASANKSGGDQS